MISQADTGKAVSEFNGYNLDQRRLKVTVAKPGRRQQKHQAGYTEYESYSKSIL
jgi:hypothetical protein